MRPEPIDPAAPTVAGNATITDDRLGSPPVGEPGESALAPGQLLAGRYRVSGFVARGGMGEVYRAEDALLGEPVAIKLLRPEVSRKPGAHERFATEIRIARKITHPNVCRVFDVGIDGERVFFTMELFDGETLASRLRGGGPLAIDEAAPLVRQLLAGVGAAHDAGVVHVDLKPSNVLLDGNRVVVTDFGLAVPCCATIGCACEMPHLIGTPAYMAPEQVVGGTLVGATDVFSIGAILFELITGRLPWTGANLHDLAHARLSGPVPSPGVDPRWDAAIAACLERDPDRRLRTVGELARMLELA
jgi:serine/threonine-protein kinase